MGSQPAGYRRDIDGLRALAVLAVVLFHAYPRAVTGGFVGVDVFFVISGFLISGLIFDDLDRGRFSLAGFYARRIRRIFPALLLVLTATLAYGFVVLLPVELAALGEQTAGGAGFVANLLLWRDAGYFDRAAVTKPLLHLWSLGVEEQFYIVWPVALWVLHRARLPPLACILAAAGVSFAVNVVLSVSDPTADFYSPATRLWELAAGAALALRREMLPARGRDWASVAGLAVIVGCVAGFDPGMAFPGWPALLPVGATVVLIAAGPGAVVNRVVLSNRVAVGIGLISYPLYLWHWPLIAYAHVLRGGRGPRELVALGLIGASLVLAWLTWRLVEQPIRRGAPGRAMVAGLAGLMAVVGLAGLAVRQAEGLPGRLRDAGDVDIAGINAVIAEGIFRATPDMRLRKTDGITLSQLGEGAGGVLLTGDSLLFHYGPRVQALFSAGQLAGPVRFVVGPSCPPIPGISRAPPFAACDAMPGMAAALIESAGVGSVVFGAYWSGTASAGTQVLRAGLRQPVGTPAGLDAAYANLADEVARLIGTGRGVYLILPPPSDRRFDPQAKVRRGLTGVRIDPEGLQAVPVAALQEVTEDARRRLLAIAAQTGAGVLDPYPDICGEGPDCSPFFDGSVPKFVDDKHLSARFVAGQVRFLDAILMRGGSSPGR